MVISAKIIKAGNLRKTYYYLKKNGLRNAYYAARERMEEAKSETYRFEPPDEETCEWQRMESRNYETVFSILVPAYETDPKYLREMVESVLNQTYPGLELIIADASLSDKVEQAVEAYTDKRIRYFRLEENNGISDNTNAALKKASGDYIGLLDHDDLLTPDALFEMARAIYGSRREGNTAWLLYSDEDKCNGEGTLYYEPHRKYDLNLDLLLSNNYICHFLVMKKELMKELGFRTAFDGAQDYDLVLRAAERLMYGGPGRAAVVHIPEVLYHWRCHSASTAQNPESKRYAYEAGRRAVEDFMRRRGWRGQAVHMLHLGFYRICYEESLFTQRKEAGVIGGRLTDAGGRITGGLYAVDGIPLYGGLKKQYSGYMHRASLIQEAYAVDVRCMKIRRELEPLFEEVFGVPYAEDAKTGCFAWENYVGKTPSHRGEELAAKSMEFCEKARAAGYTVIWDPGLTVRMKSV